MTDHYRGSEQPITFVLGGARSGKSRLAERIALATGLPRVYIATAQAFDAEMTERIAHHRAARDAWWSTIEAPLDLPDALGEVPQDHVVLVDCLTLWLSNCLLAERDLVQETATLRAALAARRGPTVLVSNEVGQGIVPDNALARQFRDAQGRLNQAIAADADTAILVAAGLPLVLKGTLPETLP